MTDYLDSYSNEIKEILATKNTKVDWKKVLKNHRAVIGFIQHERLIHLMVTMTVAILFVISMMFSLIYQFLIINLVNFLLLVLLVPYIFHYFKLENGVQKLYWIDKLIEKRVKS
mgnify:FL=1